jgi:signal transduction histidine kinase
VTRNKASRATRAHGAKVAAVATVSVLFCYVIGVVVVNLVVVHRLTTEVDTRLAKHLSTASIQALSEPPSVTADGADSGTDLDDAPSFLWRVGPSGRVLASTADAPTLPRARWTTAPTTIELGQTPFRFRALQVGADWVVAGQSIAQIQHVRSVLLPPVILFGVVLLVAVFAGALTIALRAAAPLEVVRRRQAEFTADASHELRTPLSVIEAEVELALSRPRDAPTYEEVLRRVGDEGRRLRHIVDDLLWLARADDQSARLGSAETCDLAVVASVCAERFQAVATRRGSTLSVSAPSIGSSTVPGPPDWIDRLVGVLVDNACKFAGAGGSVDVRVFVTGHRVVLQVHDSGPGIPADERRVIFDRFRRATHGEGGTGLGLAIADSVVRATRGTWSVGTSPLGGACMEVWWRKGPPKRGEALPVGYRHGQIEPPWDDHQHGPPSDDQQDREAALR